MQIHSLKKIRWMTTVAVFSALAAVLQFFEISLPFMPVILKLEFSDLPALLASYTLGPAAGILVELLKNCVHLFVTWSAGVGELCNFLLGVLLVVPTGLIARRVKGLRGLLLGSAAGILLMAFGSLPINGFITYPFYASTMMPMEVILDMYRVILPDIDGLWQALLVFNVPFTALKGLCAAALAIPLYRAIRPALRKRELL